jgi:hypothetical protein
MTGREDNPFRKLPERPKPEELRAEHDVSPLHDEDDSDFRENTWFLRTSGG